MKIDAIAIIPARGGSKRIHRKNIKDFLGKPIIAYSIEAALASNLFQKVIVSTDDDEVATIAKEYGAIVPYIRPSNLSDDFTNTTDVIEHMIDYLESSGEYHEYICTIYATAPLLDIEYLAMGYDMLRDSDAINSFGATSMPSPIQRAFKIDTNGRCEMFTPQYYSSRSQDLDKAYRDAGQFYWSNRARAKKSASFVVFSKVSIPILLPRYLAGDIDTIEDWKQAELMYKIIHKIGI